MSRRPVMPDVRTSTRPAPLALTAGVRRAPLGVDPDTSLVQSLRLHLMSEHQVVTALRMSEEAAGDLHEGLHRSGDCDHQPHDLRFRPAQALADLTAALERHETVQRLIVPPART